MLISNNVINLGVGLLNLIIVSRKITCLDNKCIFLASADSQHSISYGRFTGARHSIINCFENWELSIFVHNWDGNRGNVQYWQEDCDEHIFHH